MAVNGLGDWTIAAGETNWVAVWFDNKVDMGPLYFSAHPLEPNCMLVSRGQSKHRDDQGGITYGFHVTNIGTVATHFSIQGGGFIDVFERDAGGLVIFGDHEDRGAQFCSATPFSPDDSVTMAFQVKVQLNPGQFAYGYVVADDPVTAHSGYHISGGGFIDGFNKLGDFSIETGETVYFDGWWFPPNAEDHGAQYFSADPEEAGISMTLSDQSKTVSSNGRYTYGFSVSAHPVEGIRSGAASFTVQGGGFV
jgi:hypothetical protein